MIRQGSSTWVGPAPRARQARWATTAGRRPMGRVPRPSFQGVLFTAVAFLTVVAVAAAVTPGGLMSIPGSVVSNVISQKGPPATATPATVSPSPTDEPGPSPEPSEEPEPPAAGAAAAPAPAPVESGDEKGGGKDGGGGGPGPSGSTDG